MSNLKMIVVDMDNEETKNALSTIKHYDVPKELSNYQVTSYNSGYNGQFTAEGYLIDEPEPLLDYESYKQSAGSSRMVPMMSEAVENPNFEIQACMVVNNNFRYKKQTGKSKVKYDKAVVVLLFKTTAAKRLISEYHKWDSLSVTAHIVSKKINDPHNDHGETYVSAFIVDTVTANPMNGLLKRAENFFDDNPKTNYRDIKEIISDDSISADTKEHLIKSMQESRTTNNKPKKQVTKNDRNFGQQKDIENKSIVTASSDLQNHGYEATDGFISDTAIDDVFNSLNF